MLRNYKDILLRTEALRQKGDAGAGLTGSPETGFLPGSPRGLSSPSAAISASLHSSLKTPSPVTPSTPSFSNQISISPLSIVETELSTSPGFTPRKLANRISPVVAKKSSLKAGKSARGQEQSPRPKPSPRISPRNISTPRTPRCGSSIPVSPFPLRDLSTPPTAQNPSRPQVQVGARLFDESEFPAVPSAVKRTPSTPAPPASVDITNIKSLKSLLWCEFPAGSFIMLDLDETLIQTRHSPSMLLSTVGARLFKGYVQNNVQGFKNKNAQVQKLQEALKDKVLVEGPITTNTIKELQAAGYWVFGLTTRYSSMADSTTELLLKLGIDFSTVAPFPPTRLEDPMTGAVVTNGVVYCNGFNKGFVLNRILENVVFAASLRILKSKGVWTPPKVISCEDRQSLVLPPLIVLVDDVRANLDSMLEVNVAKMLRIPVAGFHFTPPHLEECQELRPADDCRLQDLNETACKVLMLQMEHIVVANIAMSNARALTMLKEREDGGQQPDKQAAVVTLHP